MKDRGDPVRYGLAVAVDESNVQRNIYAGPRHHLPFEGIAVNVDNARQDDQAVSIDRATSGMIGAEVSDESVGGADVNGRSFEAAVEQNAPAGDAKIHALFSSRSSFGPHSWALVDPIHDRRMTAPRQAIGPRLRDRRLGLDNQFKSVGGKARARREHGVVVAIDVHAIDDQNWT